MIKDKNVLGCLFCLLLLTNISVLASDQDLRHCSLLPILDEVNPIFPDSKREFSQDLYIKLESYLLTSSWCFYRSSEDLLKILSKYKANIYEYLHNPNVLKEIAQREAIGSMIRITIYPKDMDIAIGIEVVGDDGESSFYREDLRIQYSQVLNADALIQNIFSLIEAYGLMIPYDGKVISLFENQIVVDTKKTKLVKTGDNLIVKRKVKKRTALGGRGLLEWQTHKIATAKVATKSELKIIGVIETTEQKESVRIGDWVQFEKAKYEPWESQDKVLVVKDKEHEYYRRGVVLLEGEIGKGLAEAVLTTGTKNIIGGIFSGMKIYGEGWFSNSYGGSLEIGKGMGFFTAKEGNVDTVLLNMRRDYFKLKGHYRFFPFGYFYGAQIKTSLGYGRYKYFQNAPDDGFGNNKFGGLFAGVAGEFPVGNNFRIISSLDYFPMMGFMNRSSVLDGAESSSVSSMQLDFGGRYHFGKRTAISGTLKYVRNKAEVETPKESLVLSETTAGLGFWVYF